MLGDRVGVYVPAPGEYGGEFAEEPVVVENVCVEPAEAMRQRQFTVGDGITAVMFMDADNSPNAFDLPIGSLVEWEGERMQVVKVLPLRVGGELHHWEVWLS